MFVATRAAQLLGARPEPGGLRPHVVVDLTEIDRIDYGPQAYLLVGGPLPMGRRARRLRDLVIVRQAQMTWTPASRKASITAGGAPESVTRTSTFVMGQIRANAWAPRLDEAGIQTHR